MFGVAFAAAMSRPGAAPVATLAIELASMQRWTGVDANGCPAPHRRDTKSNVAKNIG
ncbi:MAG TPA: hypothetical protein VGE88_10470 [Lysobacter sp.]